MSLKLPAAETGLGLTKYCFECPKRTTCPAVQAELLVGGDDGFLSSETWIGLVSIGRDTHKAAIRTLNLARFAIGYCSLAGQGEAPSWPMVDSLGAEDGYNEDNRLAFTAGLSEVRSLVEWVTKARLDAALHTRATT